ncbi:MAG: hypothetical protein KDK66_06550 [Deltaproteobacteria bacterium]|nr:hypothetical protein [Deltaproteobacteria bacterium]
MKKPLIILSALIGGALALSLASSEAKAHSKRGSYISISVGRHVDYGHDHHHDRYCQDHDYYSHDYHYHDHGYYPYYQRRHNRRYEREVGDFYRNARHPYGPVKAYYLR